MKKSTHALVLVSTLILSVSLITRFDGHEDISYSDAMAYIQSDRVSSVLLTEDTIELTPNFEQADNKELKPKLKWRAVRAGEAERLEGLLLDHQVVYKAQKNSWLSKNLFFVFILSFLAISFFSFFGKVKKGSSGDGIFGFTKHKGHWAEKVETTFEDVAGYESAKEQLHEVVDFLKDPACFSRLGAKIPKGVLLHGPPGTGKTLMARATAGEAGVPFLHISGSDFEEIFVGVGAGRVGSLFSEARKHEPCIIFIDEIDAVGQHRSSGSSGGATEHNQTINKLLAEMDGFEKRTGVIVIAATNRPEMLDPALKRRLERKVFIGLPGKTARAQILRVHAKGKTTNGIDFDHIAQLTPGMSGGAMESIFNEAALIATRENAEHITTDHLVRAIEIVAVGFKDRTRRLSEDDRRTVAVHEAGHAIVSSALGRYKQVTRVSIIPTTSGALGYNFNTPEDEIEVLIRDREEILTDVMCLLGGRAAEDIINRKVSTGASDDLRRANLILYHFVATYGLSETLAHRSLCAEETQWSQRTANIVDEEIERFLKECYARAAGIIRGNCALVGRLTGDLLEHEELSGHNLSDLLRQAELPQREETLSV